MPVDQGNNEAEEIELPETNYFRIETPNGDMTVRLYDETPAHRDNFKKLVAQGYYDGTLFHRIIENFMIQGGDPNSKDDDPLNDGQGGPGYTVPAEFKTTLFHKRGALAAARQPDQVNPQRASSGSQFYIVQGQVWPADMLNRIEGQIASVVPDFSYPEEIKQLYTTEGGTPGLDMQYTVFGELVEGFEVLDTIAGMTTPRKTGEPAHPALIDRPPSEITITIVPVDDYSAN